MSGSYTIGQGQNANASDGSASPRVSVVIPAYNVGAYIADTLSSVFAQSYRDFEVIVVNDGSEDTAILEHILEAYLGRLVYVVQANAGPSAARNMGIRLARGEYVAFLDGDDLWLPECLGDQIAHADGDRALAVIHGNARVIGDRATSGMMLRNTVAVCGEASFVCIAAEKYSIATSCVMVRRDWCIKVGSFDPALRRSEDFDLWLRITHAGGRFAATGKLSALYRRRADGASADQVAMLDAKMSVLTKCEQSLRLSAEERAESAQVRLRLSGEKNLVLAKRAFAAGEFKVARDRVLEANAALGRAKLRVIALCLAVAPRTLAYLHALVSRVAR